ncbi:MAG: hypothetical protein J4431_03535 [Candidatus Aenigmarchaeota archaeon]|nr:hypothetical protein [Candidatus Aenigmarchaeota archaeon]
MKAAIIGMDSREESPFIRKAEGIFDECVYVPADEIRIESGEGRTRLVFGDHDIAKFEAVLPFPSARHSDLFLSIVTALEASSTYIPYGLDGLLAYQKKLVGAMKLRRAGFELPKTYYAISENAVEQILPELEFPIRVTIGERSSLIEDARHMKSMIRLRKSGQAITIRKPVSDKIIGCFVVGNDIVSSVEIINGKMRGTGVGTGIKEAAVRATKSMGSAYGFVTFAGDTVASFSLSPPFATIERLSGKDVFTPLLEHAKANVKAPITPRGILSRILDLFGVKQ